MRPIAGAPGADQLATPVAVAVTLAEAYDNVGISSDDDLGSIKAANLDWLGNSFSQQALAAAGFVGGSPVTVGGVTFTWPDVPLGQPDNVLPPVRLSS